MVASPEVFKSPNSDCYVVFGEAKTEDMNAQHAAQMAAAAAAQSMEGEAEGEDGSDDTPTLEAVASEPAANPKRESTASIPPRVSDSWRLDVAPVTEEEEEVVDETGVDPKDIELVIQQVGCSRSKAVRVLKESNGDLINASKCLI